MQPDVVVEAVGAEALLAQVLGLAATAATADSQAGAVGAAVAVLSQPQQAARGAQVVPVSASSRPTSNRQ